MSIHEARWPGTSPPDRGTMITFPRQTNFIKAFKQIVSYDRSRLHGFVLLDESESTAARNLFAPAIIQ